jgi:hypothetical protein
MNAPVTNFDRTRQEIAEAKTVEEVQSIRDKMTALVAYYKAARDPEKARKAAELKIIAETRIGEMTLTLASTQGARGDLTNLSGDAGEVVGKLEILKSAGISTQDASMFERLAQLPPGELAKAAAAGKSARSVLRVESKRRVTELEKEIDRWRSGYGALCDAIQRGDLMRMNETARALRLALAGHWTAPETRIAELEMENARLKADLEALQKGDLMRISAETLRQRRELASQIKARRAARREGETIPDEKTKEELERRIAALETRLKTEKSKVATFLANGRTVIDRAGRKDILVCLHPDGTTDPHEKARRERAFQLFTSSVPEPEF